MGRSRVHRHIPIEAALALVAVLVLAPTAHAKITLQETIDERTIQLKIYGFSQLEARGGDGYSDEGDLFFRAQRVRIGFNYFHGPISGKLFLDVNQSFTSREAGLPKAVKDAFVAYTFSNAAFIRLGMIKTPVGMGFTIPGWNLDILERQKLDKGLVLERDFGLMVSGRLIGQERYTDRRQMSVNGLEMGTERQGYGLGYDVGVFNPAGRSDAVIWNEDQLGGALAYAARVHYDHGPELHAEVSYGISEEAGGPHTADYSVLSVGVASELRDWGLELKAEYLSGSDIRGIEGWDQGCWSLTAGYMLRANLQAMVKTYQAEADHPHSGSASLGNTYVGFNLFLSPLTARHRDLQRHKLVINYIFSDADDASWTGLGGLADDAWGVSWQYRF
jgi:hypothetical protein